MATNNHSQIEIELVNEISRLRAVLAEQRALISKLLGDRDKAAQMALNALSAAALSIKQDKPPVIEEQPLELMAEDAVKANRGFIRELADKIAATPTPGG